MKDGKMIIASGTLPVTFNLDNMLKVGLIKLREGEGMDQHDMVVNKQREILEKLEPETLRDMIFNLWEALSDTEKERDEWTAAYAKELKLKCEAENKLEAKNSEALMWERHSVAKEALLSALSFETEELETAMSDLHNYCTALKQANDWRQEENDKLREDISQLIEQHLDTGPMLPKNGVTISYT